MDDFATIEERRNRWYARHLSPRYCNVVVSPATLTPTVPYDDKETLIGDTIEGIPASLFETKQDGTVGRQRLQSQLTQNGFAVIVGALPLHECRHALDLAWDYVEAASAAEQFLHHHQLRRNGSNGNSDCLQVNEKGDDHENEVEEGENDSLDPPVRRGEMSTYSSPHFPRSVEGGILPYYGSGHSAFAWYVRSRPILTSIFASFYQLSSSSEPLLSSLDGVVIWRENQKTDEGWFHIDQNPRNKPDFAGLQGLVNILPVTQESGGNVVVARSHTKFPLHYTEDDTGNDEGYLEGENCSTHSMNYATKQFYHRRLDEVNGDDWLEIDPNDTTLLVPSNILTVLLQPGDVLVWDSRLVHCSYPGRKVVPSFSSSPLSNRSCSNVDAATSTYPGLEEAHGLIRVATLVSMVPKSKITDESVLISRRKAVDECQTLTHWVNKVVPLAHEQNSLETNDKQQTLLAFIKKYQRRKGNRKVLLSYDDLNADQKALIG